MNYLKHYNKLIDRAKCRHLAGYSEKHHIIPRCMGGSDESDNLVKLTPEEHFVAHQLLVKIYPTNTKLILAVRMMCITSTNLIRNNKQYSWLKERFIQSKIGIPRSEETKLKLSENAKRAGRKPPSRKGATMSAESRIKIGNALRKESPVKVISAPVSRKHSEETKVKIRENHKGMLVEHTQTKLRLKYLLQKIIFLVMFVHTVARKVNRELYFVGTLIIANLFIVRYSCTIRRRYNIVNSPITTGINS
jgi:hypothetical protein